MERPKTVLVVGAGAIGGYIGASLSAAGHRVGFLCTHRTAALIRAEGILCASPGNEFRINPDVYETAEDLQAGPPPDLIIAAVKRYDLQDAVSPLRAFSGAMPPILSLQNGIGAEQDLAELLGEVEVIAGTVTTAVGRPRPNEVVVERFRGVGIAGPHPYAAYWVAELSNAGLGAQFYGDAESMKWSKVITNLIANPVSAICDMPPSHIFAHKGLFKLEMLQLREALAVMKGLDAEVVDLPGTPVRLLAFCARFLPLAISRPLLGSQLGKARGGKMPSFHGDLHSGRGKSEIGYLHGAVVREGQRLGIKTPVNSLLVSVLSGLISGRLDPGEFRNNPEALLSKLN